MGLFRPVSSSWYIPALLIALLFATGCKKSEADVSGPPRLDQAAPSDTLNTLFGFVRQYDDDASNLSRLAASEDKRRRLIADLQAHKEPLSDDEKDVARLFLDDARGGVLFEMLFTQKLVEIDSETPHGDSVEVPTKVAETTPMGDVEGTQQVFLFELRKKGANWVIEDFKARGVPEGVYARWHKETGK